MRSTAMMMPSGLTHAQGVHRVICSRRSKTYRQESGEDQRLQVQWIGQQDNPALAPLHHGPIQPAG